MDEYPSLTVLPDIFLDPDWVLGGGATNIVEAIGDTTESPNLATSMLIFGELGPFECSLGLGFPPGTQGRVKRYIWTHIARGIEVTHAATSLYELKLNGVVISTKGPYKYSELDPANFQIDFDDIDEDCADWETGPRTLRVTPLRGTGTEDPPDPEN